MPAMLNDIAHLLRRTSFGPFPGSVEALSDLHGSYDAALDAVLAAPPLPLSTPARIDEPLDLKDEELENEALITTWIERMSSDGAGLHEKMTWFWHTHFTSSVSKSPGHYLWRQLRTFHQHALGNFGDLTKAMCVDGAMLQWLDAGGSTVEDPNENLARELLELFTMGRGHYSQDDVRAAAMTLAGWSVLPDEAYPTRIDTPSPSVTFLGRTEALTPDTLVDRILEHPATAPFIVSKISRSLIGAEVPDDRIAEWAGQFRDIGYEIGPMVAEMLRSDDFLRGRFARARTGMEWVCSVIRATGVDSSALRMSNQFAQIPFLPPNVAGWPDRWISTTSLYARAAFIEQLGIAENSFVPVSDPVPEVLAHCGLFEVSEPTRAALEAVWAASPDDGVRLLRSALITPEFTLS